MLKLGYLKKTCALLALACAVAGCGSTQHINCDVARLQKDNGRSDQEIAASFQASPDEVAKCFAPSGTPGAAAAPASKPAM